MMSPQFINHAFIYFNERRIVIQDDEGYDETVKFHFDEEGAEGFAHICNFLQDRLPSDSRTYCF